MRCTEVADRPFPDGNFTCRDIGDRWRYVPQPSFPLCRSACTTFVILASIRGHLNGRMFRSVRSLGVRRALTAFPA